MPTIHVLDEKTINKIAAGEVVERPASAIKEMVENAIDAGSTSIEVAINEGGVAYMRVTDNGVGMSEEDARLAILRHATSKIREVEDLFDIASLGFRGEALASIASVSRFELTTRKKDEELGVKVSVEGGHFIDCMLCGANLGTTVEVRDLFYNTPARKKFLKTARTESSRIQDIIGKLAISNLHIAFKLIVDDRVSLVTPGNGNIFDCLGALHGFKITDDLFPVSYESEGIFIEGAISKPSLLKSSRLWQTTIVNNRVITDKTITKAIDNAYHALLPKTGFPLVVLNIIVPSEAVDINVHPRKSEVKFADDKPIFKAVYHAVLQALENTSGDANRIATDIIHDRGAVALAPLEEQLGYISKESKVQRSYEGKRISLKVENPNNLPKREDTQAFVDTLQSGQYKVERPKTYVQEQLVSNEGTFVPKSYTEEDKARLSNLYHKEEEADIEQIMSFNDKPIDKLIPLGQVASCYIIAKKGEDLYIIDQHAAHERVRYDKLCKSTEDIPLQALLIPLFYEATDEEIDVALENEALLMRLGFGVMQGGPSQLKITEIPADLVETKAIDVLQHIFTYLLENQEPTNAQLRHTMLAYASCRGAIKAGHTLNTYQMTVLMDDLFHTDKPYVCPHGRPTIVRFTPNELGKLFNRD